jgi:hypothetical protein
MGNDRESTPPVGGQILGGQQLVRITLEAAVIASRLEQLTLAVRDLVEEAKKVNATFNHLDSIASLLCLGKGVKPL